MLTSRSYIGPPQGSQLKQSGERPSVVVVIGQAEILDVDRACVPIIIIYQAWLGTPSPRGGVCRLNFARKESALLGLSDSMSGASFRAILRAYFSKY